MTTLGFFYFDMTYILWVMLPTLLLAGWAQLRLKSAYAKGSQIASSTGMTGAQAARQIMEADGITGVRVERVQGFLSDHYDPRNKVLRLSPEVHDGRSLASLGIAAHEAGHALQDAQGYSPLVVRNAIVPLAGLGSNLGFIVIFIGLALNMFMKANVGIPIAWGGVMLFALVVLFQLINLPVEFNASSRARERLLSLSMVTDREDAVVGSVLGAAAMTYVAGMVGALLNLLYYAMLVSGASRD